MLNAYVIDAFKTALSKDIKYIEKYCPIEPLQILLFGSLARGHINNKSDIDLCLVFDDDTNPNSYEMRSFKGMLRGLSEYPETDVVVCTNSRLKAENCLLYKEINRDKIVLNPEFDTDFFLHSVNIKERHMNYFEIALKSYNILDKQYEFAADTDWYNLFAAECPQIIEKMMKGILELTSPTNGQDVSIFGTHSLTRLARAVNEIYPNTVNIEKASWLGDYYFDSKYPGDDFIIVNKDEALKIKETTQILAESLLDLKGSIEKGTQ